MTKIGFWNIRGLSNPLKQKEVLSFVRGNKISLFGVIEANVRATNLVCTVAGCFPSSWMTTNNLGNFQVARIIVGRDPQSITVSLVSSSEQMMVLYVDIISEHKKFCLCCLW